MNSPVPFLSFGPFRLPADLDLLYRGDEIVALEPRAVQVLRHLVRNAGRVVSKKELLDQVWEGKFVTEGVLKRAICQIRRALESQAGEGATITTYHRCGYRLTAPTQPAQPGTAPRAEREAAPSSPGFLAADMARTKTFSEWAGFLSSRRGETLAPANPLGFGPPVARRTIHRPADPAVFHRARAGAPPGP